MAAAARGAQGVRAGLNGPCGARPRARRVMDAAAPPRLTLAWIDEARASCHAWLMPNSTPPTTTPVAKPPRAWLGLGRLFGARRAAPPPPWTPAAAPVERPLPQLSDYALQHVIARNDRTTIYRAGVRATGAVVALKTVRIGHRDESGRNLWRERFLRESAAAARLKHDCIVRVHAGGVQGVGDGLMGWLAMEWVHGTDLSRYATPSRLLPEGVVLAIAQRVALALACAHGAGVVHRDVKPSNVLFDPTTGVVKVTDFGSARVLDAEATRSGLILGTPAYMAPEQLAGAEITPRCDLYALGVLLYELLAGVRPFEARSMGDLLARIAHETPRPLRALRPELPPLLEDIVARLLSKDPADRQASARQVAVDLRLARALCRRAAPGSATGEWADTLPGEDPGADPPSTGPAIVAIQGTMDH